MVRRSLPLGDMALRVWVGNYTSRLGADPGLYNHTPVAAAEIEALGRAYAEALAAASEPRTRTAVNVARKNETKQALMGRLRASILLAKSASLDPAQYAALGVLPPPVSFPRLPPPQTRPVLRVVGWTNLRLTLHITDHSTPTRKARPALAHHASIYLYFGETAVPSDLAQWRFLGIASRWRHVLQFAPADAGQAAFLAARWVNRKGQPGPRSDAVCIHIPICAGAAA